MKPKSLFEEKTAIEKIKESRKNLPEFNSPVDYFFVVACYYALKKSKENE